MVFERPKAATTLSVTAGGNEFTVSYTPASSTAVSTVAVGTLANETPVLSIAGCFPCSPSFCCSTDQPWAVEWSV